MRLCRMETYSVVFYQSRSFSLMMNMIWITGEYAGELCNPTYVILFQRHKKLEYFTKSK